MPSKRTQLQRIQQANAEEAQRIQQQIKQKEAEEAERLQQEQQQREAEQRAAAQLAQTQRQVNSLFDQQKTATINAYQPKTQVKKRIHVLNTEGYMQVISLWWAQHGSTLTTDELDKILSRQLTYCNRVANDRKNPILIQSEHIEYIDEVKAK